MQTPTNHPLDLVEQQLHQVAAFLAQGHAPELQQAASALQALAVDLQRAMQAQSPAQKAQPGQRQRLQNLARSLQLLRDNLSRQAALNQQTLQVVMPGHAASTYGGAAPVYGAVARQSGAFRVLAA